jgi:hypothetical protein
MKKQRSTKTQDCNKLLQKLLSFDITSIPFQFPNDFHQIFCTYSFFSPDFCSVLSSKREAIFEYVSQNSVLFTKSSSNLKAISIIILQTFCLVLQDNFENISSEKILLFIKTLLLCKRFCLSHESYYKRSFSLFYEKASKSDKYIKFNNSILVIISSLLEFISVSIQTHLDLCLNLLNHIEDILSDSNLHEFISFFNWLIKYFLKEKFSLNHTITVSLIFKQFTRILQSKKLSEISKFYEIQSVGIVFCLILSYMNQIPFANFVQIHEYFSIQFPISTQNKLVSFSELLFGYPSFVNYEESIPKIYQYFFHILFTYSINFLQFSFNMLSILLLPLIKKGSLEAHRFLLLFLFHLSDYHLEHLISEKNLIDILFPPNLFLLNSSSSKSISVLRKLAFDCFFLYFPAISEKYFLRIFIPLLTGLKSNEKLFAEVLNLTLNNGNSSISRSIRNALLTIFNHFENDIGHFHLKFNEDSKKQFENKTFCSIKKQISKHLLF